MRGSCLRAPTAVDAAVPCQTRGLVAPVDLEQLARTLCDAYGDGDLETVASLLSAEVVSSV